MFTYSHILRNVLASLFFFFPQFTKQAGRGPKGGNGGNGGDGDGIGKKQGKIKCFYLFALSFTSYVKTFFVTLPKNVEKYFDLMYFRYYLRNTSSYNLFFYLIWVFFFSSFLAFVSVQLFQVLKNTQTHSHTGKKVARITLRRVERNLAKSCDNGMQRIYAEKSTVYTHNHHVLNAGNTVRSIFFEKNAAKY